jgi:DNA-binding transcriptional ArsR family regulator
MTREASKIKVGKKKRAKFYPLTQAEFLKALHELKPAERDLLIYLRILDPFGERTLDLTVTSLAEVLGVHKSTISRALKVLNNMGYISLELTSVRVRLRNCIDPNLSSRGNCVASAQQELPSHNKIDQDATNDAPAQQELSPRNERTLQPAPVKGSGNSKTIHNDHTDQNSLKTEREDANSLFQEDGEPIPEFRDWLVQSMNGLPERPRYPERWIEVSAGRTSMQKDFINSQNTSEGTDVPPSKVRGQKIFKATEEDVLWQVLCSCRAAVRQGNQMRVWVELQRLWKEGWQEVCIKVCEQLPDCGVRVGENGLEQVQPQDDVD